MSEKQQKPNILVFSLAYFPFVGGQEIALKEIAKRLEKNFEFDLITARMSRKLPKQEKIENINVYRVGIGNSFLDKFLFQWISTIKANQLHKTKNYTIIWGMMAFAAGWAALRFKEKHPNLKYLLTLQSGDSDKFIKRRTWFWHWRYKQIYIKADLIQSISKWLEKRARRFGYTKEILIIPNGVDLDKIKKLENKSEIRKSLNINNDTKVIISVSRLVYKNGLEDLIRACAKLNFDYKLFLIGEGNLKEKLESVAKSLNIQDKIVFTGKLEHSEITKYYSIADVFVRPSITEGFGNVFVEAMATKITVIATPVGGITDFLIDNKTGFFCQVGNPIGISQKIKFVLDSKNSSQVQNIIDNAFDMVEEKYSWDKISQDMYNQVFQKLIKEFSHD